MTVSSRPSSIEAAERRSGRAIRFASRLVATAAAATWLFVIVAGAFENNSGDSGVVGWVLAGLVVLAVTGTALLYFNEGVGAFVLLVASAALAIFAFVTAGRNHFIAFAVSGAPFLAAGGLALVARWREAARKEV